MEIGMKIFESCPLFRIPLYHHDNIPPREMDRRSWPAATGNDHLRYHCLQLIFCHKCIPPVNGGNTGPNGNGAIAIFSGDPQNQCFQNIGAPGIFGGHTGSRVAARPPGSIASYYQDLDIACGGSFDDLYSRLEVLSGPPVRDR